MKIFHKTIKIIVNLKFLKNMTCPNTVNKNKNLGEYLLNKSRQIIHKIMMKENKIRIY
jgi:hypothetical protein